MDYIEKRALFMKMLNRQSGLTLNELLIALSVVAILVSLGAPSYSEIITKRKVAGAANMITMFIENMKMVSIKRNEFVTISYKRTGNGTAWCLGAVVGKDAACDCTAEIPQCLIDAVPTVLSNETHSEFNKLHANFDEGYITFDPVRGILTDPADTVSMEIKPASEDYQVNITVNATGRVSKCSPAEHKLVGYVTCI